MRLSIVAIVVGSLEEEGTTDRLVHEWSTHQNMEKTTGQGLSQVLETEGAGGRNRTDTRLPSRDFESHTPLIDVPIKSKNTQEIQVLRISQYGTDWRCLEMRPA
jgi:hypothetical protein